ncbi:hypothetical protein C0V75_20835 [Tabrizicola sp. TH137]|uniref:hypothetical protein n=1 Tax=Tabrizicola sp. TH137 TaxID=2067452 RepID=UPI000C7BD88B|nr:hypothetical protein [Tabrizicola sp. TH137]PLL10435.1 hypothetical protein C0V75_20835 [Tabrizicola sp. TH137]
MNNHRAWTTLKYWCERIDGKPPSTCKIETRPRLEADRLSWWYAAPAAHNPDTPRNIAYLAAYVELAGPRIPMRGIYFCFNGYLHLDRAVMRSLHAGGLVKDERRWFVLTDAGSARLAPWLTQDGNHFRRVTGTEQKG